MKKLKSFIDASVLIAAARGKDLLFEEAIKILDDPRRELCSSPFIRLEVLPKAIHNRRQEEADFYQAYFADVTHWAANLKRMFPRATDSSPQVTI